MPQLEYIEISSILVGERFREDFGDMEGLMESIRDKGVLQPITLDSNLELKAGGRRLEACKRLGLEKIPALIRNTADDIDGREVELIENTFRKDFEWPEKCKLIQEIDRLYKSRSFDWSGRKTAALLSRSVTDVARALKLAHAVELMPELGELKTADEALKSIRKMEEQVIIQELRNRQKSTQYKIEGVAQALKVADANYHIEDTFKVMSSMVSNGVVELIECDPPYGIDLNSVKKGLPDSVESYNEVASDDYQDFLTKLCTETYRIAARSAWMIFWFGPTWFTEVKTALTSAGWIVDDIPGIWIKPNGQSMQPNIYLGRAYEPFFICRKGQQTLAKPGRLNVFNYSPVPHQQKYHPTQRPVELMEELLSTFAPFSGTVYIPFLGSGATLRAAYNLGMKAFGCDLNPEYKDRFMLAVEEDSEELFKEGDED